MKQHDSTEAAKPVGIVLIATGNPYYVNTAYNLCLSIKAQDMAMPVTLISDNAKAYLNDVQRFMFDEIIPTPSGAPFMLKTMLYSISPYQRTLYLDADMIFNPAQSLTELLNSLNGIEFTIANRGIITDHWDWGSPAALKAEAGDGILYNLSSEVIYFEKTQGAAQVFELALDFYRNNQIIQRRLGGYQPDEPSFTYALAKLGKRPHLIPWHPSYWMNNHQRIFVGDKEIQSTYFLVSMGGAQIDQRIVKLYTRYAAVAGAKVGASPIPYMQKRLLVKERATV